MPPKKVVEEEKRGPWALGRFSSNLKVRSSRVAEDLSGLPARAN